MREFWKSVNIWRSYGQEYSVLFFLTHSVGYVYLLFGCGLTTRNKVLFDWFDWVAVDRESFLEDVDFDINYQQNGRVTGKATNRDRPESQGRGKRASDRKRRRHSRNRHRNQRRTRNRHVCDSEMTMGHTFWPVTRDSRLLTSHDSRLLQFPARTTKWKCNQNQT